MHTPSMITPILAAEVIGDHTRFASAQRASRRERPSLFGRFRRRSGASRPLVPRGRIVPPVAH